MNPSDLKLIVKEKYGQIASSNDGEAGSCCGTSSCCSSGDYSMFSESYDHLPGYNPEADLNLGCGIPID
ncbi:MAG: arsenite S-adenosylmethyltransferase, partial [Bacteroidales bacterium]|nr:arsenite S-adenosylmethyltransferase [Bacteroidales bacterium]